MEINGDYGSIKGIEIKNQVKEPVTKERPPGEGDTVKGKITDISNGRITVVTETGQSITARLSSMLQAQIGDEMSFIVKYDKGMMLEPLIPDDDAQKKAMIQLLKSYSLRPTEQNIKILQELFTSGMPLTKESFTKFNQALKLVGGDFDKANFMLQSGISLNTKNAEAVSNIVDGTAKMTEQIKGLLESLDTLSDGELKAGVLNLITGESDEQLKSLTETIKNALSGKIAENGNNKSTITTGEIATAEGASKPETVSDAQKSDGQKAAALTDADLKQISTGTGKVSDALTSNPKTDSQISDKTITTADTSSGDKGTSQTGTVEVKIVQTQGELKEVVKSSENAEQTMKSTVSGENPAVTDTDIPDSADSPESTKPPGAPQPETAKAERNPAFEAAIKEAFVELTKSESFKLAKMLEREFPDEREFIKEMMGKPDTHDGHVNEKTGLSGKPSISFKYENSSLSELENFLNGLKERISDAREYLRSSPSPEKDNVLKEMNRVTEHLDILAQLKQGQLIQFPVSMNERNTDIDLFSFNDKKSRRGSKSVTSALIALDTANMGHFESYVRKNGRSVSCHFRVEERVAELVRQNISQLNELLEQKQYRLESYTVGKLNEPFTVLDEEPSLDSDSSGSSGDQPGRKLIIDIRA